MPRKNTIVLLIILALFAFALSALAYPLFGREGMQLGLDLRGGIHMVYQADFSGIEPGNQGRYHQGSS